MYRGAHFESQRGGRGGHPELSGSSSWRGRGRGYGFRRGDISLSPEGSADGLRDGSRGFGLFGVNIPRSPDGSTETVRGGGFRSNWRGRGGWRIFTPYDNLTATDKAPLGHVVTKIKVEDLQRLKVLDAMIRDVHFVASYSLVDCKTPKILIPGKPAAWTPPELPKQLEVDSGDYLRDPNGARFPDHPILPMVQSVFAMNKSFDPSTVDIVACASSLGNLFSFARSIESTFRFDVELVGNTLFMVKNAKADLIPNVLGYGHSFLDAFTSYASEVGESKSHQRIVGYRFGGLNCLVRYECDGYDVALDETYSSESPARPPVNSSSQLRDSISQRIVGGHVAQQSIVEIKTRSQAKGPIDASVQLPRLWVRQIPNVVLACHNRGVFDDVQKSNMKDHILEWERGNQLQLKVLASSLHQLIMEVKKVSRLRLEVYRDSTGPLQLRMQYGEKKRSALPDEWETKWTGVACSSSDHSSDEEASNSLDSQEYPAVDDVCAAGDSEDSDEESQAVDSDACSLDCESD